MGEPTEIKVQIKFTTKSGKEEQASVAFPSYSLIMSIIIAVSDFIAWKSLQTVL